MSGVREGEEVVLETVFGTSHMGKALKVFLGDEKFQVDWGDKPLYPWIFRSVEEEKKLFWWRSDAHYPLIYTPLHEDIHVVWDQPYLTNPGRTSVWFFDRYWYPTGIVWPVRRVGARLYEAIVPPPDGEVKLREKFYNAVISVYADKAVEIWERLREKSKGNLEYLDSIDYDKIPFNELLVVFQDALDFYDEHFKSHWYVNIAYYAMLFGFIAKWKEILKEEPDPVISADLSISVKDANWDRLKGIWKLKEEIKKSRALSELIKAPITPIEFLEKLKKTDEGKEFLKHVNEFLKAYGWTSPYVHQLQVESWYEKPEYFIEELKYYYVTDFDWNKANADSTRRRDEAVKAFNKLLEKKGVTGAEKEEMLKWMERCVKLAPVNPDHHFYYDQGTQTRVGFIIRKIGKRLAEMGLLEDPGDVFYLRYDELRSVCVDPKALDSKKLARERRKKLEEEYAKTPYLFWFGTATEWAIDKETWRAYWGWDRDRLRRAEELREIIEGKRAAPRIIKGKGTGTPVGEGPARVVISPRDMGKVKYGDVVIAIMTSPAWAAIFPRIKGLVTDSGSPVAHPAIVSRIWNVPCVVGAEVATQVIKDGQKVRVNGMDGTVQILE